MSAWRRLSIVAKLPICLGALLVVALTAMAAFTEVEVKRWYLEVKGERLDAVATLLADLLGNSTRQRVATLHRVAERQEIVDYLQRRDPILETDVMAILEARGASGGVVEVWDSVGHRIATSSDSLAPVEPSVSAALMRALLAGQPETLGPYAVADRRVSHPIAAAVRTGERVLGAVVERRFTAGSRESIQQLSELIGSNARTLIGNAAGDVWTDLAGPVNGPSRAGNDAVVQYVAHDGQKVLARVLDIPDTPWLIAMEFPIAPAVAEVNRTIARAWLVALLIGVIGTWVGLVLTRRIILPLNRLTDAAEAMAHGRSAVRVTSDREDEIGRLAGSFNAMVDRVEDSWHTLEGRVAERTDALERANQELESFSYSVSHDLRAPLRAVDGFAAVLEEDHAAELSPAAQRALGLIRKNAQQMGQLIDDLLAFSRLGRQPLNPALVDMAELARTVVADLCVDGGNGSTAPRVAVGPLPPALGERSMLRQVFANYIHNAIKFSRGRTPPCVEIGCARESDENVYFVRDNGVGFDMRYSGKLFGVFQRLHSAEQFEGTGVGLAIVHRVVMRHGGRVWAHSAPDQGATFYFALPTAESHSNGAAGPAASPAVTEQA
ncbi:MAG: ATP-binding protein [Gemmatimonadetes bacterium]|nr:ATP-binding protein [Gemmatimonadota bacterium]